MAEIANGGNGGTAVRPVRPWRWGGGPGWTRLFLRLYRLRLAPALVPAAPALFLLLWYSGAAFAEHLRHNAGAGEDRPLTVELFHLHLHDHLTRDVRALSQPQPGRSSPLPTLSLFLDGSALEALASQDGPEEGPLAYVEGYLRAGRETHRVRVRHRGTEPWHRSYPQKSWKVRVEDGGFVRGFRTFSLVNTPEPLSFDEQIPLDVCRELGLPTPSFFPVRLLVNDAHVGVYYFLAQPDADLVAASDRVPGSLFSGNDAPVDPATGVSALWNSAGFWKKVATADGVPEDDIRDLAALLAVVGHGSQRDFAAFARDHVDVGKLALMDAVDVVFGANRHDFGGGHKLLLDPGRGRFEPIAWDFRGPSHTRAINRAENPLLLRLKELPEYLSLRNRTVWELLDGSCSEASVRARAESLAAEIAPDQAADPFWDAYDLLPGGSRYLSRMVRPMTAERQRAVLESRLDEHGRRVAYLRAELSRPGIAARLAAGADGPAAVDVTVDGHSGYTLDSIAPEWPAGCRPARWRVFADRDLDGSFDAARDPAATPDLPPERPGEPGLRLFPGVVLEAREPHPTRGAVVSGPEARTYRLFLDANGCTPVAVRILATSLVTGAQATVARESTGAAATESRTDACVEPPAGFRPGRSSLHPWCCPERRRTVVRLGPGTVSVAGTRYYGPDEPVEIAAGTTLLMAPGASLVTRGGLRALGTAEAPIRFVPEGERWGGLAILGPDSAGSTLSHVEIRGGTSPAAPLTVLPGTVDIHDTAEVSLSHCRFEDNRPPDDVLHVVYVRGLTLDDVELRRVSGDAVDLAYSDAVVRRLTVVGVRQEALDLMGGRTVLEDSVLLDSGANAVSAGQRARLEVSNTIIAGAETGLLLKSGSSARLRGVVFHGDPLAVELHLAGENRPGHSSLETDRAFAAACGSVLMVVGGTLDETPPFLADLPQDAPPELPTLLRGAAGWRDLGAALDRLREDPR